VSGRETVDELTGQGGGGAVTSPVLLAYPPKSGDSSTIAFAAEAARLMGAPLVIVSVHPGGTVLDRLSGGEFEMHADSAESDVRATLESEPAARDVRTEVRVVEHSTPARGLAGAKDHDGRAFQPATLACREPEADRRNGLAVAA